ncbi:helix-turn-helix domain-containing protein [Candidatus Bathyarchaeota archaeon]|nr:helix-turn-helix domain-containing protein [Candidatus Bathyarchaeota archaeon]
MTQKQRILDYLKSGKTLTRLNSWSELGILECPARVSELRQEGYPIKTEMVPVTNRFGERVKVAKWSL